MNPLPPSLFFGRVGHARLHPRRHSLRYRMFSLLIDVDRSAERTGLPALFSIDRFNLVSFHAKDHGARDGNLRRWVTEQMRPHIGDEPLGRIQLLSAPRVLGMIFNPISVYFCHRLNGELCGVIFDVSNFHSGRCAYTFPIEDPEAGVFRFRCPKAFFVSPFNPVAGDYAFRLRRTGDAYHLGIQLWRDGQCVMNATHKADRRPLDDRNLAAANFIHPFNTIQIVGAILFEALKLRLKGLQLYAPRRGTIDTLSRRA